MLDEFREDVIFLSLAVIYNDKTDLPVRYLEAFYQEEFDKPNDPVGSTQDRPTIPPRRFKPTLRSPKLQLWTLAAAFSYQKQ